MTDDLADVIRSARLTWRGGGDGDYDALIATAVRARYLALGGVTDEDVTDALEAMYAVRDVAVEDLIARAVGHACAERDAHLASVLIESEQRRAAAERAVARAEAAEDERDALRADNDALRRQRDLMLGTRDARVERALALVRDFSAEDPATGLFVDDLLAALDGEA